MRILVLCYEYPPIGGGGGRVAKIIAERLAARGHEVRVQTAGMAHLPREQLIDGVEVFRTRSFRRREDTCGVHEMGLYVATSFLPTLRHIREWKPDVMHAHFAMPTGVLAWAAHRSTGAPYVLTAHLGDVPGGVPEQTARLFKIVAPVAKRVWARAAAATAVSTFVKGLAEAAYPTRVTVIPNGIDMSDAAPPEDVVPHTKRLVFLGRFSVQKNPLLLIEALARIPALPWQLTMIGDGPLRHPVEVRAKSAGIGNRVRLTGWLPTAEVQAILRESDILCLSSLSEGMPVAAIEALKHGLAIMATNIPGVQDVVEDGVNGYLAPGSRTRLAPTASQFADKLGWLIESDAILLQMKRASWKKAHDFDLEHITSEYERVLSTAAQTNKARG